MHHANLLIGSFETALQQIDEGDRAAGPDVLLCEYASFGIAEARALKYAASLRPVVRPYRVFILSIRAITLEAQNALLKLFEEPTGTRFYLIAPREDLIIPTLRSRLARHTSEAVVAPSADAETFLKSPYRKRLEQIAARAKEKDWNWFEEVLAGAEKECARTVGPELRDVIFVRNYERGSGASKKMLLEHLALSL